MGQHGRILWLTLSLLPPATPMRQKPFLHSTGRRRRSSRNFSPLWATAHSGEPFFEPVLKFRGMLFSSKEMDGEARRGRIPFLGLRPRSSQPAVCLKTLRAASLLAVGSVGSVVIARCGDTPRSPPGPHPKSLAAAPRAIFRQALRYRCRRL